MSASVSRLGNALPSYGGAGTSSETALAGLIVIFSPTGLLVPMGTCTVWAFTRPSGRALRPQTITYLVVCKMSEVTHDQWFMRYLDTGDLVVARGGPALRHNTGIIGTPLATSSGVEYQHLRR